MPDRFRDTHKCRQDRRWNTILQEICCTNEPLTQLVLLSDPRRKMFQHTVDRILPLIDSRCHVRETRYWQTHASRTNQCGSLTSWSDLYSSDIVTPTYHDEKTWMGFI